MNEFPNLGSNSPITEALIDIRTQITPEKSIKDLEALYNKIKADFPVKKERRILQGSFEFKKGTAASIEQKDLGIDGLLLHSKDEKEIVQFRLDGFTFNRLYPYETWEKMRKTANKYWELYVSHLKPTSVHRIAIR